MMTTIANSSNCADFFYKELFGAAVLAKKIVAVPAMVTALNNSESSMA